MNAFDKKTNTDIPLIINGKIFVCCPADSVTGGPELLHQLVDALRSLDHEAFISYYPFNKKHKKPSEYSAYNTPISDIEDEPENLLIFPEVFTKISTQFNKSKKAIWWLSVDNYFHTKGDYWFIDLWHKFVSHRKHRASINEMKSVIHLTQSAYARDFLLNKNQTSYMLTDYLSIEHKHRTKQKTTDRQDIVAYNPKKGIRKTNLLRKHLPDIKFLPIERMSKTQLIKALSNVKIYMDFGSHPGKDRLPREAVMAGCCIITGIHGAAKNDEDIPIPIKYKLNDSNEKFIYEFKSLVDSIFKEFEIRQSDFQHYRAAILNEPNIFKVQVLNIFGSKSSGT